VNVRENLLREKIDPFLSPERLGLVARLALSAGPALVGADAIEPGRAEEPAAGLQTQVAAAKVLSGGCWNRVIAVSFSAPQAELVYKISPEEKDEKIVREYKVLGYFSSRTAMPVPRPLFLDTSGKLIPGTLLVMTRLPGVVLHRVHGLLSGEMIEALTEQIAAQVIELHKERSRGFGGVEVEESRLHRRWADFWLPRFDAVTAEISGTGLLGADFLRQVAKVRQGFAAALDIGESSTLTHYDIWSGNVMVDFEGCGYPGRPFVSGYIDLPGFWADYARELSFMEMFGLAGRRFYERYWSAFPRDPGFELRKNIYNLKMHLKHIGMYPKEGYYRRGAESCLRYIQRFL
jgi:fructosamine-3-kinase